MDDAAAGFASELPPESVELESEEVETPAEAFSPFCPFDVAPLVLARLSVR